jgi:hypothetical protein
MAQSFWLAPEAGAVASLANINVVARIIAVVEILGIIAPLHSPARN